MEVGEVRPYTGRPWVFRVSSDDPELEVAKEIAETDGGLVELSGSDMRTVEDLWACYGKSFAFQWEVENWPSFAEQMRDLSWYQAFSFLTVVSESAEVLADDPDELATFMRILEIIGQAWENSSVKSFVFTTILI